MEQYISLPGSPLPSSIILSDCDEALNEDSRIEAALAASSSSSSRWLSFRAVSLESSSTCWSVRFSSSSMSLKFSSTSCSARTRLVGVSSIAMTSFLPKAEELRADLAYLADDARIFWLDVTAPGDGACFALTDPSGTCRENGRPQDALNPLVISAAFKQTMAPGQVRRYRWRLLRMHFQYLCAFARPDNFDYFRITAGPRSLASRFSGRECSPSMLAEPVAPVCHAG